MQKRSVTISGHQTSISIEEPFWRALKSIAQQKKMTLAALIGQIDRTRTGDNLSSALRLAVLKDLQHKLSQESALR